MFPLAADQHRVISCDVFDTLLLRDQRSELSRFRTIGSLASHRLESELGLSRSPSQIWRLRNAVQQSAYRALDLAHPEGEIRFADMIEAMARILLLDAKGAEILRDAEIAVERAQLTPNTPLLAWLKTQARNGKRIIAVSDTYHPNTTITDLLDTQAPGHPVACVYTSADCDATKRSGALFEGVLKAEKLSPENVLHLGDNHAADFVMARAAGLSAEQLKRPALIRTWRKLDAAAAFLVKAFGSIESRMDRPERRIAIVGERTRQ